MDTTGAYQLSSVPGYEASAPGIQIGTQLPFRPTREDIDFVRQLGVEWVMIGVPHDDSGEPEEPYESVVERIENEGLKVYRLGNSRCHNMPAVTLNLPGREEKMEEYLRYIERLGEAGIRYSTYAHMANGIWSGDREPVRGGATGRAFHIDGPAAGHWTSERYEGPFTHGREYSEDELWANYEYFIRRVVPVAEGAGVYIGIHPDDPPVYPLGGIPRCIFGTFDGYRRALEIADSPNVGMCLCTGCWLEGGPLMGKDVVETIRYFGGRRKLFKVHFRTVTAPMPEGFTETFLDDGYVNMYSVMAALHETGFDGAVMSDHLPTMVGGRRAAEALAVGYIRGLKNSVEYGAGASPELGARGSRP